MKEGHFFVFSAMKFSLIPCQVSQLLNSLNTKSIAKPGAHNGAPGKAEYFRSYFSVADYSKQQNSHDKPMIILLTLLKKKN